MMYEIHYIQSGADSPCIEYIEAKDKEEAARLLFKKLGGPVKILKTEEV